MRRENVGLRANGLHYDSSRLQQHPTASFICEDWTASQVADWLKGIDKNSSVYVNAFKKNRVDGKRLLNCDDNYLQRIGIAKDASRAKILQKINLLAYYSYTTKYENLQKLSLNTIAGVSNLLNAVSFASPVINSAAHSSKILGALNTVLRSITELHECVLKLIFWLNRSPFDDKKYFISVREKMSALIEEMVDCVNNPNNPKFFSVPQVLVERGAIIRKSCQDIIAMNDPLILYTAFMERVTIRKTSASNWGFDVDNTCTGVNLITRVDLETPAGISGKIDAGDEILEINGYTVIGWTQTSVLSKLGEGQRHIEPASNELELLLSKRPRENWTNLGHLPKPRPITSDFRENRSKMMLDFKLKTQPDLFAREQPENNLIKQRGRSSSFSFSEGNWNKPYEKCTLPAGRCVSSVVSPNKRILSHQPFNRRASVWTESLPAMLRSPFDGLYQYQSESNAWLLLLASWGDNRQKTSEKDLKSVSNAPRDLNSYAIIVEEDCEDVSSSDEFSNQKTLDMRKVNFSEVYVVPDSEVNQLQISTSPSIHDEDWDALAAQDITGLRLVKRAHLESGSSMERSIVDSPLNTIQAKITKFFYGDTTLSASSIIQESRSSSLALDKVIAVPNCRTPNIKQSNEFLFISKSSINYDSGGDSSSVESPSPCIAKIRTVASLRSRLAPLAEPDSDEIAESSSSSVVFTNATMSVDNSTDSFELLHQGKYNLSELASIPCATHEHKTLEGWARRQRLQLDTTNSTRNRSQWIKCWMLLKDGILYLYPNQFAQEANIVVNVYYCYLTNSSLKTSKRHVFALCCNLEMLNFALYTAEDLKCWLDHLNPLVRKGCSSFAAASPDLPSTDSASINRFSALYVRSNSTEEYGGSTDGVHSPLTPALLSSPRSTNFFYPTKILNKLQRQGSVTSGLLRPMEELPQV